MKKVLFGIALILFAVVLLLSGIWLPVISDLMDRTEFAVLVAAIGLVSQRPCNIETLIF